MTITKADITHHLVDTIGLNARESRSLVENFFESIRRTLAAGEDVKLSGFGNFTLRDKRERLGRNPKTGKAFPISGRRVVTFHPSYLLSEQCNPELPTRAQRAKK